MTDEIKRRHEQLLYPVVRIYAGKAAGSGTIIYSEPSGDEYETFVLTNHHVIADLISHKNEWDSVLKRKIDKEYCEIAHVEIFEYRNLSHVDSTNRYRADIVAYDEDHDLALLKIQSPKKFEFIAKLIPRDNIKDLKLFTEIAVAGCSMAHEPFVNFGQLTFLSEIIDQKKYFMVNASSFFGNSGGALFLRDSGELIGVPSRITGIQIGFGVDIVTWMGFAAHSDRLYEFFDEQELQFLYNDDDTYEDAMRRRENRKKQALLALKAELVKESEDE